MRYQIAALLRQFGHVPARGTRENAGLARSDVDPEKSQFNFKVLVMMTMAMLIDSDYMLPGVVVYNVWQRIVDRC